MRWIKHNSILLLLKVWRFCTKLHFLSLTKFHWYSSSYLMKHKVKVSFFRKQTAKPRILPKNERINSFLLLCDVFSFVFWENPRLDWFAFEINWPLQSRWVIKTGCKRIQLKCFWCSRLYVYSICNFYNSCHSNT